MDPSRYPFVVNGPPCLCGDSRVAHVGTYVYNHTVRGVGRTPDVACSACGTCERYTPIESIDHDAEDRVRDEILADERQLNQKQATVNYVVLALLVISVLTSIWNSYLGLRMLIVAIGMSVTNMAVATYNQWKRGEADDTDLAINVTLDAAAVAFTAGLLFDLETLWKVALAVLVSVLGVMTLRIYREIGHRQRALAAFTEELRKDTDS